MNRYIPRHLSPIETYLFKDNRPSHPLDFFIRLKFDGNLYADLLQRAIAKVLLLHPMLNAQVQQRGRRLSWVFNTEMTNPITLHDNEESDITPINLKTESGLKCWLSKQESGATVTFQFQHTATDGLGAFGFVIDVIRQYSQDTQGTSNARQPSRDIARLAERHWFGYERDSLINMLRRQSRALVASRGFSGKSSVSVKAHEPIVNNSPPPSQYPHFVSHCFSCDETQMLKAQARSQLVSTNTIILRDAFVAIDQFRQSQHNYNCDDWIRIAVPGNVRHQQTNEGIPAANLFSMTFPSFTAKQISRPEQLLQVIHDNIRASRRDYYLPTFLVALNVIGRIPGAMEKSVSADKCIATLLLTNLGIPLAELTDAPNALFQTNDLVLTDVALIPPMRPHQTISIAVLEYTGRQRITMSFDPRIHSTEEADDILNRLITQLRSTISP